MSWAGIYFGVAVVSALCTLSAVVQARKLYWLAPLYFFAAWLTGELALIHLVWHCLLYTSDAADE